MRQLSLAVHGERNRARVALEQEALPDDVTEFGMYEALTKWTETRTQPVAVSWTSTTAGVEVR